MSRDNDYLELCIAGSRIFQRCVRRNYMAIIVSADGRIVGTGYNGAPAGMPHCDVACPHRDEPPDTRLQPCIAVHAEANALLFSDITERRGGTLYVNGTPCGDCSKLIVSSGISRVVYLADDVRVGVELLHQAGLKVLAK